MAASSSTGFPHHQWSVAISPQDIDQSTSLLVSRSRSRVDLYVCTQVDLDTIHHTTRASLIAVPCHLSRPHFHDGVLAPEVHVHFLFAHQHRDGNCDTPNSMKLRFRISSSTFRLVLWSRLEHAHKAWWWILRSLLC